MPRTGFVKITSYDDIKGYFSNIKKEIEEEFWNSGSEAELSGLF